LKNGVLAQSSAKKDIVPELAARSSFYLQIESIFAINRHLRHIGRREKYPVALTE
jgi:hypothetical protein